jgi:RND family efflux transporter MFP subunit
MNLVKQLLLVAGLAGLGVLGYVYGWPMVNPADSRQAAAGPAGPASTRVIAQEAKLQPERVRIEAVGTAEAVRSANLYPATSGEVVAVNISPDKKVSEGDLLLELDRRSEELAVELAEVRVKDARQLLQRYERTSGTGAVPESTVDEARTALEAARIELSQAQVALADRMVLAPFDGHVGMTDVEIGDRIGENDLITTLDDRSSLLVSFDIPEIFLERVRIGQPIQVATWMARDRAIEGEVVDLGSRIDPVSRSFVARAVVPNAEDRLRPGMSFAVTLDLQGKTHILVPEVAVQWGGDGAFLWVVREGKAQRISAKVVQRQEGTVLVDAPVEAGEPVVVEGIQRMREGVEVTFAEPLAPQPAAAGQGES